MVEDNALLVCAMACIEFVEPLPYIRNRVMTICRVPVIIEGEKSARAICTAPQFFNDVAKDLQRFGKTPPHYRINSIVGVNLPLFDPLNRPMINLLV